MSRITSNQPPGTPTWIELRVPDLRRATEFYGELFGWTYAQAGPLIVCLLDGLPVAGLTADADADAREWTVYFATDDCDDAARQIADAGGSVLTEPTDLLDLSRTALVRDTVGAEFGLWQGRAHPGCQVVNEPNSLVRNDLVTSNPEPARNFYATVFGYTLDRNPDLPEFDFTFLRLPDGHEVAGIFGASTATSSAWATTFEVADTDETVSRAAAAGGKASDPDDMLYGRIATVTDPFGTEFSVIARPPG